MKLQAGVTVQRVSPRPEFILVAKAIAVTVNLLLTSREQPTKKVMLPLIRDSVIVLIIEVVKPSKDTPPWRQYLRFGCRGDIPGNLFPN